MPVGRLPPRPANVLASLDDMIAWEGALAGHRLVTAETWARAMPGTGGYGFGWDVKSRRGRRVEWHDGDWLGASTYIARYGPGELCTVVLCNAAKVAVEDMESAISDLFLD